MRIRNGLLQIAITTWAVARLLQAEAAAQCTKDIDCKGDRVCIEGRCQDSGASSEKLFAACGLLAEVDSKMVLGLASNNATALLRTIGEAAGLENMPTILSGPVPNAAAMIRGTQRLIVYNPAFMEQLEKRAGTDWTDKFVIAHELGHHAEGHTVSGSGCNKEFEYQADAFAARVLRKLGADLDETSAAMRAMPVGSTQCHPASENRLVHIREAFRREVPGSTTRTKETSRRKEPAPEEEPEPAPRPRPLRRAGYPSGYPLSACGCWGSVMFGA